MISHKHKLIFIHIPKTGGSYIEEVLKNQYEAIGWQKAQYHQNCLPVALRTEGLAKIINLYPEYKLFTFIRNPFDRAASLFSMYVRQRPEAESAFPDFVKCLLYFYQASWSLNEGTIIFQKFCSQFNNDDSWWPYQLAYHSMEQRRFLMCDKLFFGIFVNRPINFIGKYETFKNDFLDMCDILNIPKPNNFVQKNIKRYDAYYNDPTTKIIKEVYREDLSLHHKEYGHE